MSTLHFAPKAARYHGDFGGVKRGGGQPEGAPASAATPGSAFGNCPGQAASTRPQGVRQEAAPRQPQGDPANGRPAAWSSQPQPMAHDTMVSTPVAA
jgi:hypothetical protein